MPSIGSYVQVKVPQSMYVIDSVTTASVQVKDTSGWAIAYDKAGGVKENTVRSSVRVAESQGSTSFKSKLNAADSGVFELNVTAVIVIV